MVGGFLGRGLGVTGVNYIIVAAQGVASGVGTLNAVSFSGFRNGVAAGVGAAIAVSAPIVAAAGITSDTFNPSDKGPNIALSNGGLTATSTIEWVEPGPAYETVRGHGSHVSGKHYFEQAITTVDGDPAVGLCTGSAPTTGWLGELGGLQWSVGYWLGGVFFVEGQPIDAPNIAVGEWIGFAVDLDVGKIWTCTTAGWVGDPVAGTGNQIGFTPGLRLFAAATTWIAGDQATANFGATAFAYAVPSGFARWNANGIATAAGTAITVAVGQAATGIGSAAATSVAINAAVGTNAIGVGGAAGAGTTYLLDYLPPNGDIAINGWTDQTGGAVGIFAAIDEASANDNDFVQSPSTVGGSASLKVRLRVGGTQVVEWTHTDIAATFVEVEQVLTEAQLATIGTNFANLSVEFDDLVGNVYHFTLADPFDQIAEPVKVRYRYKKLAA